MKKLLYTFSTLFAFISVFAQQGTRVCGTDEHHKELKLKNAELQIQENLYKQNWKNFIANYNPEDYKRKNNALGKASSPKYIIPVVVHVIHSGTNSSENISNAQVQSEIDFLNKSFRNLNNDTNKRRDIFKDIAADMEVEFRLARKDPKGNCTNGIVRYYSLNADKGDDNLKRETVWDTKRYLNMWVVRTINKGGGLGVAGYAQFPIGNGVNSASTDGVMMINNEFGNIGTSNPGQTPNVTTTTHEVGHWLGLFHPFQDSDTCDSEGDGVFDTPRTFFRPTTSYPLRNECGNPTYNSCGGKDYRYIPAGGSTFISNVDLTKFGEALELPDMQENYMDYFIGPCASNMFTLQQKARVHFTLENYRKGLWSAENLARTGVNEPVATCEAIPSFYTNNRNICAGGSISFSQNIYNGTATGYNWTFDGGTPATSTLANPNNIKYNTPGSYNVKLSITTNGKTVDTVLTNYVTVVSNEATQATLNFADWQYQNDWFEKGFRFESENGKGTWTRVSGISYNGIASMKFENDPFNQVPTYGFLQNFITPSFNLTGASRPSFRFAYAAALVSGPSSSSLSEDELRVFQSVDCGTTWTQMSGGAFTGNTFSTVGTTRLSWANGFVPTDKTKWKEVNLTAPAVANVRFKITLTTKGGSNFYLDEVRVSSSGAVGVNNSLENEINFAVAPNPFNASTQISYELLNTSQIHISVIDILGKNIGTLVSKTEKAGSYSVNLDKSSLNLNNGIYFIKVEINGQNFTKKVLVN